MKWRKETRTYMWANYYSEDGNWKAWDEDKIIKGGGRGKVYNPETKKFEKPDTLKHVWFLKNLKYGYIVAQEFKTLKAAKEFAEQ